FGCWLWTTGDRDAPTATDAGGGLVLPTQLAARNAPGWWALVISLLIDGSLFASLVFAYFYLWLGAPAWPPAGATVASGGLPLLALGLLIAGEIAMRLGWRAHRRDSPARLRLFLVLAVLCAIAFIGAHAAALTDSAGDPGRH